MHVGHRREKEAGQWPVWAVMALRSMRGELWRGVAVDAAARA
jgi:hypothetical protein